MSNNLFILDGQDDNVLDHINKQYVITNEHEQDLPTHKEVFTFTALAEQRYAEHLGKRNGIIVPGEDGELLEFSIFEAHKYRSQEGLLVEVFSRATFLDLKAGKIDPHKTSSESAEWHTNKALETTEWQVGNVDYAGLRTIEFDDYTNPYAYLKRIASEFELELNFYITSDGSTVTGRYVDLVDRIGMYRGRTVEFGRDLQSIRRIEKTDEIVTALYGIGPEDEKGNHLEVFVEDLDALERWGRKGKHIIGVYEPQSDRSDMTREQLTQYTRTELNKRINAVVSYQSEIVDLENVPGLENKKIRFADTIRIKDTKFVPPLYLEARIFNQKRDVFVKSNKRVELGDYVEYTQEEVQAIWKTLQQQIRNKISAAELEEYTYNKTTIDNKDVPGIEAKTKIDTDVGPGIIEDTISSQLKADEARDEAKQAVENAEVPLPAEVIYGKLDFANTILKNTNSTVFTDENGNVYYVDPDNPNFVVKITSKGIAVGTNGINGDFNTAMTAEGIIADFVNAGHMSFDRLQGGSTILGGSGDFGSLEVLADDDSTIFRANKDGLVDAQGRELVGKGGVLSQLTFVSSGELNGWQKAGWWGSGTITDERAYINGYIPPNFEVVSATLYVYSRPLRFTGWNGISNGYYHCPFLHLITYSDYRDAYLDFPAASEYVNVYRNTTEQILSGASWGGSWHPTGSKDQVITASITNRLQAGYPFVFGVKTTAPYAEVNKSLILFELSVTGYKK